MQTSEKILEILQQICDKFGIVMDENIYSLSELATTLTEQIMYRNLIACGIHLLINLIVIGLCVKIFKERYEQEDLKTRIINLLSMLNTKKSSFKEKAQTDKNFNFEKYLLDTFIMIGLILIAIPFITSSIGQVIELIKCFVCPDVLVMDYIMEHYLNYTQ